MIFEILPRLACFKHLGDIVQKFYTDLFEDSSVQRFKSCQHSFDLKKKENNFGHVHGFSFDYSRLLLILLQSPMHVFLSPNSNK